MNQQSLMYPKDKTHFLYDFILNSEQFEEACRQCSAFFASIRLSGAEWHHAKLTKAENKALKIILTRFIAKMLK